MQSKLIDVSLIVPVYNNPKDLVECISALKTANPPHSEIIIVNDGSTDETGSVPAELSVTLLHLDENAGGAAARNHGARYARGAILFFIDSDVVVRPDTVNNFVQFCTDGLHNGF